MPRVAYTLSNEVIAKVKSMACQHGFTPSTFVEQCIHATLARGMTLHIPASFVPFTPMGANEPSVTTPTAELLPPTDGMLKDAGLL